MYKMKKEIVILMLLTAFVFTSTAVFANDETQKTNDIIIKNKLFSIAVPNELKGTYVVKTEKDKISFYHKASKKAGFGGFAFGIKAYKSPADHAVLPGSKKIGELKDKKGILYDVVLKHPTDVQYDYIISPEPPKSFKMLYNLGENATITGVKGATYFKNQGMKGKDLYKDVLNKHLLAINEKWDSERLENENMSYMYNVLSTDNDNVLNKIGYIYYDVNADGIEELLIGEIADGDWKGVIYDMYTMVNREPRHVTSGGTRNRYYVCNNSFVCNEYSSGADESGVRVYNLVENSTELYPQVSFKYDGYENSENPYFISYSTDKWENVSEKTFNERKKVFEKYERFNYIPISNQSISSKKEGKNIFKDRYNTEKDYFDYSLVLNEYPKNYYYMTVKINKSKERILIITDKIAEDKSASRGLFYYFAKNGFVYPLGSIESTIPFAQSKDYLFMNDGNKNIKFYMSDKNLEIIKSKIRKINKKAENIEFETIKSADKFAGDFGEPAGDDVVKLSIDGLSFEYHDSQYKKKYIQKLMQECIDEGVKTKVQMYCYMVKKLHQQ